MRATYDRSVNAAYIYLKDAIRPGEAAHTYPCDIQGVGGHMINLDFDSAWQLIGIEVLGASQVLPQELLARAQNIGP